MKINNKVLSFISIVYIYIPIAVFLFGWTNKIVAIVTSIAIIFCTIRLIRSIIRDKSDTDDLRFLVLMVYVLEFIGKYMVQGSGERVSPNIASRIFTSVSEVIVVVFVLVGMYYSFLEISQNVADEKYGELGQKTEWETMEVYANRSIKASNDCKYNYFAYDIDDNLFYKYIMNKPDKEETVNE